jgi:hypothetical protein
MNILVILGYALLAFGVYRIATVQGTCPGGWAAVVVGGLLILKKPTLNV